MIFQCPAITDVDEDVGGAVTATVPLNSNYELLPHVLTHKPALSNCEACAVGKVKNLRKHTGAFSRDTKAFGDIVTMDHCSFL